MGPSVSVDLVSYMSAQFFLNIDGDVGSRAEWHKANSGQDLMMYAYKLCTLINDARTKKKKKNYNARDS